MSATQGERQQSGAVRGQGSAQENLDTQLGGARHGYRYIADIGDRTQYLLTVSQTPFCL